MRQSFGFLSSLLVLLFLVSSAMAQMPERCTDLFGTAPEFELCDATDETCSFNARTNGGTCDEMCASLGSYCVTAQSNDGPDRCVDSGNPDTCTTPRGTEICTCARPVVQPPPSPSCADLFGNTPEFQLCDGSDTTCSFNVLTNNERTCNDVCESVEGSTCVGAIDNEGSSCIERPPGVSAEPDTCESQQGTSICICSRPVPKPPAECPCENTSLGDIQWSDEFRTLECRDTSSSLTLVNGSTSLVASRSSCGLKGTLSESGRIVTPEESQACVASLKSIAANDGVSCQVVP